MTLCDTCGQQSCVCADEPTYDPLARLPRHGPPPLQEGPYVTLDEAFADRPELGARLKRLIRGEGTGTLSSP